MGLLNLFSKPAPNLVRLSSGSFTVDREGAILVSTLPSSFPENLVRDIGEQVLLAFREGEDAQLPLEQLILAYPSLKITARELRGGAIVYLSVKRQS